MAENQIYEISRMMRDRNAAQRNMRDASAMLSQFFQERYLSKLRRAVDVSQSSVNASPPDEVRLLRALKPFVSPDKHARIDYMIDMFLTVSALNRMRAELGPELARETGGAADAPQFSGAAEQRFTGGLNAGSRREAPGFAAGPGGQSAGPGGQSAGPGGPAGLLAMMAMLGR
ncbi:MAG: hypothetical protein FWC55_01880 [Firmicutes bacterium]|nr:hypothetical protein [Bacillota bacterium]